LANLFEIYSGNISILQIPDFKSLAQSLARCNHSGYVILWRPARRLGAVRCGTEQLRNRSRTRG